VTGAGVAAHPRQRRHDIADETDLVLVLLPTNLHRHVEHYAVEPSLQRTATVADRANEPRGVHLDQRPRHLDGRHARDVDPFTRGRVPGQDELSIGKRIAQRDAGRLRFEP